MTEDARKINPCHGIQINLLFNGIFLLEMCSCVIRTNPGLAHRVIRSLTADGLAEYHVGVIHRDIPPFSIGDNSTSEEMFKTIAQHLLGT